MTILVMGATGNVGRAVVTALVERGVAVRAVSRQARDWPEGVTGVVADPDVEHGLDEAAEGIDGVFLMAGYAAEAGLLAAMSGGHVALLSSSSADLGRTGNAMGAMHLDSEDAVRASGFDWTFVRPCSMQANLLRWRDQLAQGDAVRAPFVDVPTAMVDPADVAAVLTLALTVPGHKGQTYRVSGPAALTPVEQAQAVGRLLGRDLRVGAMTDDEAREQMGATYGAAAVEIFRDHPDLESEVQPTVEHLLGRPPGTLEDWLSRHRDELVRP